MVLGLLLVLGPLTARRGALRRDLTLATVLLAIAVAYVVETIATGP